LIRSYRIRKGTKSGGASEVFFVFLAIVGPSETLYRIKNAPTKKADYQHEREFR
jgi:hypothetical protein